MNFSDIYITLKEWTRQSLGLLPYDNNEGKHTNKMTLAYMLSNVGL